MPDAQKGSVSLLIPADASFVRVARLTASGFGSLHDLSVDDLDDLRLVVDELCGFFIDLGTTEAIRLDLRPNDGVGIEIVAMAPTPPGAELRQVDDLRQQIMEALTEHLSVSVGDETTEVRASVVPGT